MTATEIFTGALARHRLQPGDVVAAIGDNSLAIWSLVLWASVLTTGRLLAYTCNYLLGGVPC